MQAEFQKTFGLHAAAAGRVAGDVTSLRGCINQSAAQALPTDQIGYALNGQSGAAGPNLDLSTAVFQLTDGNPPGSVADTGMAGVQVPFGAGLMTTQEYYATLDPNYVAD